MNIEESERQAAELIRRGEYREAERLLSSLANAGSTYSLMTLAWIYENGCLGKRDATAARSWYEQAASRGEVDAFLFLGRLLLKEGRADDARAAFTEGAEQGHIGCLARLGRMLANGIGGEPRRGEGRAMLEKASGRGHLMAERWLMSLNFSESSSFFKHIVFSGRLLVLVLKVAVEVLKDKHSKRIF